MPYRPVQPSVDIDPNAYQKGVATQEQSLTRGAELDKANLEAAQAQRDQQASDLFQQTLQQTGGDYDKTFDVMDQHGYNTNAGREALAKRRMAVYNQMDAMWKQHTAEDEVVGRETGGIVDQPSLDRAIQRLSQLEPSTPWGQMLGPTYDPARIKQFQQLGLSSKEMADQTRQAIDLFKSKDYLPALAKMRVTSHDPGDWEGIKAGLSTAGVPAWMFAHIEQMTPQELQDTAGTGPDEGKPEKLITTMTGGLGGTAGLELAQYMKAHGITDPLDPRLSGVINQIRQKEKQAITLTGAGGNTTAPTIKPGTAQYRTAQDMAYGKLTFGQFRTLMAYNRDAGMKLALYDMARQLNPNFNPAAFEMGYKYAGNPKTQNTLVSIDNALSNFDKAVELSQQVGRTSSPALNSLLAKGRFMFGSTPVTNLKQFQTILGDDIALAIGQGAPSDYKTKLAQSLVNGDLSDENFVSTLRQAGEFLQNRKTAILRQEGPYGTAEFNPSANASLPKVMGGGMPQEGQEGTVNGVPAVWKKGADGKFHWFAK